MRNKNANENYYLFLFICLFIVILLIFVSCMNYNHEFQYNKILNNIDFSLQILTYIVALVGIIKYVDVLELKSKFRHKEQKLIGKNSYNREKSARSDKVVRKFFRYVRPEIRYIDNIYSRINKSYLVFMSKKYNLKYSRITKSTKRNIVITSKKKTISTRTFYNKLNSIQDIIGDISEEFISNSINKREVKYSIGEPFLNFMDRYSNIVTELGLKKYYINFYNLYNILIKIN